MTTAFTSFTVTHADGTTVYGNVSPCCWMNKGYGLQYQLSLRDGATANAASVFVNEKSIECSTLLRETIVSHAKAHAMEWLKTDGIVELRKRSAEWEVYKVQLAKEEAVRQAKAKAKAAKVNASYKAKGFTHKVLAVIHPRSGDDYMTEFFIKGEPTAADIAQMLKKSVVKDSYKVFAL